eukprot:TRINITY_DN2733_c0_g1_i6.p1 TRINITY_DN2733_c0_g1~~TRINITY_DN2733_c0_g1_i6.p1  ORF type:complete len:131 (-),score=22.08 TRINITY_DN2733_c0_g1_i6:81-473(-)
MQELNSIRARELSPKVRMLLLTKKILEHDTHSTVARSFYSRTAIFFGMALTIPITIIFVWCVGHPTGMLQYTHTTAGQDHSVLGVLDDIALNWRARYRPEIYFRSRQRYDLAAFNSLSEKDRKQRFFVWT